MDLFDLVDLRRQLVRVLSTLDDRQREVILLRFFDNATLRETGEDLGRADGTRKRGRPPCIQGERVRQIEAKALRILRHPSRSRYLQPYTGDDCYKRSNCDELEVWMENLLTVTLDAWVDSDHVSFTINTSDQRYVTISARSHYASDHNTLLIEDEDTWSVMAQDLHERLKQYGYTNVEFKCSEYGMWFTLDTRGLHVNHHLKAPR